MRPRNIPFWGHHRRSNADGPGPCSENIALMNSGASSSNSLWRYFKNFQWDISWLSGQILHLVTNLSLLGACLLSISTPCVYFVSSASPAPVEDLRLSWVQMAALPSKNWAHWPSPAQPSLRASSSLGEGGLFKILLPFCVQSEFKTADTSIFKVKCRNLSF